MGKWNRRNYARPRRRYYQDYDWSPPRDEPCPDPETEVWQDNVPMWEKKFCYLVGRMPWKKVLSTKNFMNCHSHSSVLSWDDSAGEEAFLTAKKRFWEEFNGLPCETQLPSPDMYIDQIDWNPYIDPELVREADREYFNPDDKYHLPSTTRYKGTLGWPDDLDDPWERGCVQSSSEKNKASGWGQLDDSVNNVSKSNKEYDPWERCHLHENGATKERTTGWNQWDNSANHTSKVNTHNDPWENHNIQGNKAVTGNTWGGDSNKSWVARPKNYSDLSNNNWSAGGNSWRKEGSGWQDRGSYSKNWNQGTGDIPSTSYWSDRNRPQEHGSHRGTRMPNGRGGHWGQKPRDKYNWGPKDSINIHRNQGQFNGGCRKRGSPDQYVANQGGPRLEDDGHSSYYWNGWTNKRVSFGGQWS